MPGVRCLPRDSRPRMAGAVKRLLEFGYAGADGGFDGSGSAAMRSAAHTRGAGQRAVAEAEGWHDAGRHWSASHNYQRARGHAAPSFLSGCSRRLRSAEPAAVRVCCCPSVASGRLAECESEATIKSATPRFGTGKMPVRCSA